jgi:hypothetical protein
MEKIAASNAATSAANAATSAAHLGIAEKGLNLQQTKEMREAQQAADLTAQNAQKVRQADDRLNISIQQAAANIGTKERAGESMMEKFPWLGPGKSAQELEAAALKRLKGQPQTPTTDGPPVVQEVVKGQQYKLADGSLVSLEQMNKLAIQHGINPKTIQITTLP